MLAADDDCCAFIESGEDLHAGRKAFPDLHPASFRVAFLDDEHRCVPARIEYRLLGNDELALANSGEHGDLDELTVAQSTFRVRYCRAHTDHAGVLIDTRVDERDHPGGSVGYKLTQKNKSFIYLCDNEFDTDQKENLTAFAEKADVLIWDGMFTEKELVDRKGWGHSSIEQATRFNEEANCKRILISHHAPARSDQDLDRIASSLPELFTVASDRLEIEV